ncbi:MAG: penicillin acylase family protein [Gemmatimonadaceae bacterium]
MFRTHRRIWPATLLILAAVFPASAQTRATELLWDTYGVPHIFAPDDEQVGYGFGWAQMHAHANLILHLYGEARGRSAEYWMDHDGVREASDIWIRRMGIASNARRWYEDQDPAFRRYLDAFARGMNDWAARHRAEIPDSLAVVLPVTAVDVLAHGQRVITTSFVTSPERVGNVARAWERGTMRAADDAAAAAEQATRLGSNAWAIGPAKSASGHAMLLANPHLPWGSFYTWFEAQLVTPGMDLYGATLVGSPIITIGFNEQLAWTHTVNTHDGQDIYEVTIDGDAYRWDGAARPFATRSDTLLVRDAAGRLTKKPLVFRETVHGPVIAEKNGKALALRVVGLDRAGAWKQWWDMGRARSRGEFTAALQQMQIPMFTMIYADRAGHIMHLFGGLTPMRPRGDWVFWQGIVRGDSSSTLWTTVHEFGDLPLLADPPSGWLQNANDPPWTTTVPLLLDPSRYPSYMAPRSMAFRPQRSARLLADGGKLTLNEMVARKHDTRMELADRVLDDLTEAVRAHGDGEARQALDVLIAWDRQANADSRGAVLFAAWWRQLGRSGGGPVFAQPWNIQRPLQTPDGLANPAAAARALTAAARDVQQRYGRLDVAYGEVNRIVRDGVDLPGNGGSGSLGVFRVAEYAAPEGQPRATVDFGDSFVAAVQFSTPLEARVLTGYGNWSRAGSKHRVDQLSLFAAQRLRTAWRTRPEIEANLEFREVVGK